MRNIFKLIVLIASCYVVGWVGSAFTLPAIPEWYMNLRKPFFNPPDWIFAPVWISLYTLMGMAAYFVLTSGAPFLQIRNSVILFYFQLLLNGFWSILFFGLRSPFFALLEILVLWLVIFLTLRNFFSISKAAGWLFVPYLVWVGFAVVLNLAIVFLNPST